ncbi:MAG: anaerobic sulfite reductase subunit AsrA [Bacilli bacterium]
MAYKMTYLEFDQFLNNCNEYDLYGPVIKNKGGKYSDTDLITYRKVKTFMEMDFTKKSNYSAKDVLLPLSQTLFYFTETEFKKPKNLMRKSLVFVRSCDLHAVERTDQIYLNNKYSDIYYQERRELVKYIVVGCTKEFDNCNCVSFESNKTDNYAMAINLRSEFVELDIKDKDFLIDGEEFNNFKLDYVNETTLKTKVPQNVKLSEIISANIWEEYSSRCIGCGACNMVCPTCTCFTMQDIIYDENKNVGERKRVMASCMIDGFTDMAGGHKFREDKKDRMRFKVMHKIGDFKSRFGYNMCVGCGRCDDVCPEHILFSNAVDKVSSLLEQRGGSDG